MIKIDNIEKMRYITVPREIFSLNLPNCEEKILSLLYSFGDDTFDVKNEAIAKLLNISETSVAHAIPSLSDKGLIKISGQGRNRIITLQNLHSSTLQNLHSSPPLYPPESIDIYRNTESIEKTESIDISNNTESIEKTESIDISSIKNIINNNIPSKMHVNEKKQSHDIITTTKQEKPAISQNKPIVNEIPAFISYELFTEYIKMRKMIKKPMTDYAIKLAIEKLKRFKQNGEDPNEILKQSISNSWQGLYSLREYNNSKNNYNKDSDKFEGL